MAVSRKVKKEAELFLSQGFRVYHYRKDLMGEKQVATLREKLEALQEALKDRKNREDGELRAKMNTLDPLLKKVGGKLYPKTFLGENVDMLLVAALVVIGIRTFFAQPFIIPTNSMYPTYAGVTHHLYQEAEDTPGFGKKLVNLATLGARHKSIDAPVSGELFLPLFSDQNSGSSLGNGEIAYNPVSGRNFGIWPVQRRQYYLFVGTSGDYVTLTVPRNFVLDRVIEEKLKGAGIALRPQRVLIQGKPFLRTGLQVEAGDPVIAFDIRLGDMLFVDRMSYHFKKPKVGDPFVFKTQNIPGLVDRDGKQEDKYYIKRLVGKPGDTLEVQAPVLLRNGEPISGKPAFQKNHEQVGEYEGYVEANPRRYAFSRGIKLPLGSMSPDEAVTLPGDAYYAMGDNSDQSLDSRTWGYVPQKSIIGKAFFVYYPLSQRWGPAR